MAESAHLLVRPFDGSLADAEGILAVERASFNESPYQPPEVQAMLTSGVQYAWLASEGSTVAGFVIAFFTGTTRGSWWEIDLLAVHPAWRGRHLGSRLIRAAASYGSGLASQSRAVVGDDNPASVNAFVRCGYRIDPGKWNLLVFRPRESTVRLSPPTGLHLTEERTVVAGERRNPTLLRAWRKGQLIGQIELVEVQTLLYRGVWIELLQARERSARRALIEQAMRRAVDVGLDEIGAMVPHHDWELQQALYALGFRSLGDFRWLTASLPLPEVTVLSTSARPGRRRRATG